MTPRWSTRASGALAAAALLAGCGGSGQDDLHRADGVTASSGKTTGRDLLYWGEPEIVNRGDKPIVLRSARPSRARGLKVRRVFVAGPDRGYGDFGIFEARRLDPSFHRDRWRPLAGYRVPTQKSLGGARHDDVQVIFELEPVRRGTTGSIDGVTIEYEGGSLKAADRLAVCAPFSCREPHVAISR